MRGKRPVIAESLTAAILEVCAFITNVKKYNKKEKSMTKILLIEPSYKNKYPPLALMKISTYHKSKGDKVVFAKGKILEIKNMHWDRIYISTLFTFHWKTTLDTIDFYKNSVTHMSDIFCGGVLATVLAGELRAEFDITILPGLLDKSGILGDDDCIIDVLPPDYSIIEPSLNPYLSYDYSVRDSYIVYATRGCIRSCSFCAVPTMEPCFTSYIDIKHQVNYIKNNFGEKKHLLLLDNNVLASDEFYKIIDDIKELGYQKGATYRKMMNGRTSVSRKYVDFNQGIDARLLTRDKCLKLSEIAIRPLRIAFDSADEESVALYKEKTLLAAECGIEHLSNYMLFNFEDKPEDFYNRLHISMMLNETFSDMGYKSRIWIFPMKYTPTSGLNSLDRKFIGINWNRKYLRAIQCVLNATHGVVGPKKDFFHAAFGKDLDEFFKILAMPEKYIINRNLYEDNGLTSQWYKEFKKLSPSSVTYDFIMNCDLKSTCESDTYEILRFYR